MAANDGTPLIRNIRCEECGAVLHGDYDRVSCSKCGNVYATQHYTLPRLARDEVVRFTTTNALVAMTTAYPE